MPSYFERYLNGEYEAVWQELLDLGPAIREEPLFSDALAVARETMRRAKDNVETLITRLLELGYQFHDKNYFVPPANNWLEEVEEIERLAGGPIPLALRAWYELVGAVSFAPKESFLPYLREFSPEKVRLIYGESTPDSNKNITAVLNPKRPLADQFEVFGPRNVLAELDYKQDIYYEVVELQKLGIELDEEELAILAEPNPRPDIVLTSFSVHKFHSGGKDLVIIKLPNAAIDGRVEGVYDWGNITFVEYLRENFKWGGFPGLVNAQHPPREILDYLTKDLLPI